MDVLSQRWPKIKCVVEKDLPESHRSRHVYIQLMFIYLFTIHGALRALSLNTRRI